MAEIFPTFNFSKRLWHGGPVVFSIRPVAALDLDEVTPLAGSRDRAEIRLRAAAVGDDSMLVAARADRIVGVQSVR